MFANILEAASFGTSTNARLSKGLKSHSETLCQISKSFVERGKELVIFSFYETDKWNNLNCRVSTDPILERSKILTAQTDCRRGFGRPRLV